RVGVRARPNHVVLPQFDRGFDRDAIFRDRRLEQSNPLVVGLDVSLESSDFPKESLGGRHDRVAKLLAAAGSRIQRAGGTLEAADALDQVIAVHQLATLAG